MNIFNLVWSYLRSRPLNTALNILLLGLGIAVATILLVVNRQLQEKIVSNSRGIDLVVGAKGSPLQLILCNIFHVDFPTGNIKLYEAERITRHRLVKESIPMALGDSYAGYRIIGTTQRYAELYDGRLSEGDWWRDPMEVTIGAAVAEALKAPLGFRFTSSHGITQGGHAHAEHAFVVRGILEKTNSVLDHLILTGVESIWQVHDLEPVGPKPDSLIASTLVPSVRATDSSREITSVLIRYRSAMGAIQMPRLVNSQSGLQAASPAFETARLFSILGVGVELIRGFALILIFISALSIFIALYNSLKERKYDLAIMRSLGASKSKIFFSVLLEGSLLTFLGTCFGLVLAHVALFVLPVVVEEAQRSGFTALVFYPEEGIILAGSLLLGILCALLPALQAYRTDISKVLAGS